MKFQNYHPTLDISANPGPGKTSTVLIEEARKKYGPNASPLKNFDQERDDLDNFKSEYIVV